MNHPSNTHSRSNRPAQQGQREIRSRWAQETLDILEKGYYRTTSGVDVQIGHQVERTIREAVLYRPQERASVQQLAEERIQQLMRADADATSIDTHTDHFVDEATETKPIQTLSASNGIAEANQHQPPASIDQQQVAPFSSTTKPRSATIECTAETTLQAAERLLVQEQRQHVMALNFASARNPGGGFLGGSQAQEESLARSSSLYPSIVQMEEMYQHNRREKSCMYSDYMIYSPDVTVFRNDDGSLREQPYAVSMLTAPAVNAGIVREREPERADEIEFVMKQRIRYLLSVAAAHGQQTLVLGAFGCGVFRNDPAQVASWFHDILQLEHYAWLFDHIVFAVLDRSKQGDVIRPFHKLATI